ncbi:BTAD domain-containing putative transcriptional regulator [Lentzea sp. DG1S-22]|uniref:AfsR/SARP family transcriptional regulator n=1 Tax=Lentzea sp. DG1S-22 TaxID=3108822 RepID=UPI002E76E290|nr:BTAD domain-containing putative transcriptional regulator [Lentzea sp. DG1S-22]WVH79489.1 BTAD domain-containing putative transcriptional regulator [Lentzea sp. DG1S-22]
MSVEFRVLGPLEVLLDGEPVAVPTGRGQVLLATLLLRPNEFVPVDALIERIWDGEPPTADRARKTLHMVVARLRSALGPADCVRTRPGGYLAEVEPDQLDLLRFRALAASGDHGAASALWRGPVLGNVSSDSLHREDVPRLAGERLDALESRLEADLDRGLGRELVAELKSLVADHPLRESFWRYLMLALYRSGLQAEALATYQKVRRTLADELGVDPGPALRALHQQVLRGEVPAGGRQVPRQLPAGVRNFVGRDHELRLLDKTTGVTVVHGVGGVGKTALVLHWARQAREEFPDGDLHLDLRGFDPEAQPVDPVAAAETLLVGLGVQNVPAAADARFALLRTTLVDRRLLLVLDNAASPRQVLPLLPGAAGVRVVITSRNQLRALVLQHDATAIALDELDLEAGRTLLGAVLGEERIAAEPEAAREIVERCTGLPLALRVFAERVSRFPDVPLREFVAELDDARLDALTDFDDVDVRAVFSWSYRALDAESARMFRLLSVHPGVDFDAGAAAALAGVPVVRARRLLERLVADHLVQSCTPGRYSLHDLLRAYSAELCGDDGEAALRLTEWYLHTLENATALDPSTIMLRAGAVTSGVTPQEFSSWSEALRWRRQEWPNLKAVTFAAIARGWQRQALMIPIHLHSYFVIDQTHRHDSIELYEAVRGFGSVGEQGVLHCKLASTYKAEGRWDDSLRSFETGLSLLRAGGDRASVGGALGNLSTLYSTLGRREEADATLREALAIAEESGNVYQEIIQRGNLTSRFNRDGRWEEALREIDVVAPLAARHGDEFLITRVRGWRAQALAGLGRFDEAEPELRAVVEVLENAGDFTGVAEGLVLIGEVLVGQGRSGEASVVWQQAVESFRVLRDARADALAARVEALR